MGVVAAPVGTDVDRAMALSPLFEGADVQTIRWVAAQGHVRTYRRGTYIFHQGDPAPDVYFLIEGRVEVSTDSASGHRQLHTTLDTPQFLGELGVLGDLHRTSSALTLQETKVWVAPAEVFFRLIETVPEAARALLRALARQVVAHEAFVEDLLHLDLKGRVAKRMLQLVTPSLDDLPASPALVPAVVTHADLASLCGGSRENVTRILSEFQRRGLVARDGRRYVLLDPHGLAKLAGI